MISKDRRKKNSEVAQAKNGQENEFENKNKLGQNKIFRCWNVEKGNLMFNQNIHKK